MPGFYAEYFDGTSYVPCSFKKYDGATDVQVYQVTYFNGTSDVVIGTLPAQNFMSDGYFDWNVTDGTSIGTYGWSSPTNFIISGNALKCGAGKGTYGVDTVYNTALGYMNLEFLMKAGFVGEHYIYGWGAANGNYLVISPSAVQLRLGDVWQGQVSGTYSNIDTLFGVYRSGSTVTVKINNVTAFTVSAPSFVDTTGSIAISMVPGTVTSTSSLDYIRWF